MAWRLDSSYFDLKDTPTGRGYSTDTIKYKTLLSYMRSVLYLPTIFKFKSLEL